VRDGLPELEDGRVLEVANVIWCTGFVSDFRWIELPILAENGHPVHDRGVAGSEPGLYFVGLVFQYSLSSVLIGGVGRDAEHVVRNIASCVRGGRSRVNGGPTGTGVVHPFLRPMMSPAPTWAPVATSSMELEDSRVDPRREDDRTSAFDPFVVPRLRGGQDRGRLDAGHPRDTGPNALAAVGRD
jgi:hypothetical protein